MKFNNKGFAISTILYGLSVLILVLLTFLMKIVSTDNSNSKYYTETIKKELDVCSDFANNYRKCYSVDECRNSFKEYVDCYCKNIYKDTSNCYVKTEAVTEEEINAELEKIQKFYELFFPSTS